MNRNTTKIPTNKPNNTYCSKLVEKAKKTIKYKQLKAVLLIVLALSSISCSIEGDNLVVKLLPIDSSATPSSFTFNTIDTITIKYSLPNSCHSYHSLLYQFVDTARVIAVRALENLDANCTEQITENTLDIPIEINQSEDYVFKFWIGLNSEGEDQYDEKIVPVIN
ncbi:MAG: hypothetical protein ACK5H1_01235 [Tenacibaculum sp.]